MNHGRLELGLSPPGTIGRVLFYIPVSWGWLAPPAARAEESLVNQAIGAAGAATVLDSVFVAAERLRYTVGPVPPFSRGHSTRRANGREPG